MKQRKKAIFNWSGGKDSALALQKTLEEDEFNVVALFSTLNEERGTSSVHAIPTEILNRQAESIGIPLYTLSISSNLANYKLKMLEAVTHFKMEGVSHFIFGDLLVSDVKSIREAFLNPLGIEVVEPLWHKTSEEIMLEFLSSGIQSSIIVTQADKLDKSFIGKNLNAETVNLFPSEVDVCGEKGEYHTLSYAGGLFKNEISFKISSVNKVSQDIGLENGQIKTYEYWEAEISAKS